MTRSSQQPPAAPRAHAEPASEVEEVEETEETGAVAAPGTASAPDATAAPESGTAAAKTGAETGQAAPEAPEAPESERTSGEAGGDPAEGSTTGPESGARAGAPSEPDSDPGATAAAQSRLPALVRTMTATAIDRPQQEAGPVGRPGKAVLAGAAVAGALLVSVPFLVLAGNDDKGPERQSVAAAGTVLDGSGQETPGEFAVTPPETGAPGDGEKAAEKPRTSEKPVRQAPVPDPARDKDKDAPAKAEKPKDEPKEQSAEKKTVVAEDQPAKAAPAVTLSAPVSFRSHLSGRCIDVPNHDFSDGKALHVWDCNNAPAQKWQFASDGTIRIKGFCLDVANANFSNGTVIQIAWCNGNAAQKFTLNASHDLVNTVVGMCVDIANAERNSGARLQLLTCTGNDAQKWST